LVVDTHVFRIARRLELAKGDTPEKVEQELMQVIPREPLDQLLAPDHSPRPPGLHRPQSQVQPVCNLEPLCRSKDKTWRELNERVSGACAPAKRSPQRRNRQATT
jgi:endonuclease III